MSKMLGPDCSYMDILYHAVEKNGKATKYPKRLPLRPSSSGKCTRELAFKMMEYLGKEQYEPEVLEPQKKMLLDLGHFVEKHMNKWMWEAKEWFRSKYKDQVVGFYDLNASDIAEIDGDKLHIEGEIDDVYWSDVHKCIVDYKSKGDKFNRFFKTEWDETNEKLARYTTQFSQLGFWIEDLDKFVDEYPDPNKYFISNFLQLNGYACTEFIRSKGIDHAAIIQYNKNDSRVREIRFKPSMKLFDSVRQKFQTALDAAGKGDPMLAPMDFSLGTSKCGFCQFRGLCYPNMSEKAVMKEYFKTLKKKWPTDTSRTEEHEELETLFAQRELNEQACQKNEQIDQKLLVMLQNLNIKKIRLDNGHVYEVKLFKSPKPHEEIRRSKV